VQGLDVLVVDDDPDAQEIYRTLLERAGARVTCASSAAEALSHIDGGYEYQVLVSDIAMPERDGLWLVHELKQRAAAAGTRVLAIAVTGSAIPEIEAAAVNAGFDLFLVKPVDHDVLLSAVGRYRASPTA
jgi:CheY-like chemotaxis protein